MAAAQPAMTREIADRMADTVPDLSSEWREYSAFAVQHDRAGYAVRVACRSSDRVPTKLPAGIQNWIRKTPTFTLDNPHVTKNGTLFVDIVPTDDIASGQGGKI